MFFPVLFPSHDQCGDKKDAYVNFDEKRSFQSVRFDKIKRLIRYEQANNRIVN